MMIKRGASLALSLSLSPFLMTCMIHDRSRTLEGTPADPSDLSTFEVENRPLKTIFPWNQFSTSMFVAKRAFYFNS